MTNSDWFMYITF